MWVAELPVQTASCTANRANKLKAATVSSSLSGDMLPPFRMSTIPTGGQFLCSAPLKDTFTQNAN